MSAFLAAIIGAASGFVSGLLAEKVRGRLNAVRAEMARLDDLHDEVGGVVYDLVVGREVSPSALQKVDRIRTRVGENLKRLGYSPAGWGRLQAGLEGFQREWAAIENAALEGTVMEAEWADRVQAAIASLRRGIHAASQQFPLYRLMGER